MKNLYILLSIILLSDLVTLGFSEENKDYQFFPNLPAGKFNILYRAVFPCSSNSDELLRYNLYLYKVTHNTTVIKGNLTFKIPLDDSLWFNTNMAVKDSIGGWKDNAFVLSVPNACSWFMKMMGSEWDVFWNSFGINHTKCPLPAGTYIGQGHYDLTRFITHANFPSSFFYGTYKTRISFSDKNKKEQGCAIFVMEFKRLWENE